MDLGDFCRRMAEWAGIELDNEGLEAIDHLEAVFGRPLYFFSDFIDALAMFDPSLDGIDIDEAHRYWFRVKNMETQRKLI